MRKYNRIILYVLFAISYACFFSIGVACLLNLLGVALAVSLDGSSVMAQYPRFIPFCLLVGLLALAALIVLAALNIKYAEKLDYKKHIWILQCICAFAASMPMIKLWGMLFDFLQKAF